VAPGEYFPGRVLNRACAEARGQVLVFQNSDAVPLGAGVLGALVAALDTPRVAAAIPRQLPRPVAAAAATGRGAMGAP
jgi:rhamnosyltransferase